MNKFFLFIFCLFIVAPAAAADKDAEYLALVDAAVKAPDKAEWCKLRDLYPDTSFYRSLGNPADGTAVPQMGKRMLMERDQASVDAFRKFSREHFASWNAHRYAAYLYKWHQELAREKFEKVLPDFGKGIDYIDFKLEQRAARELYKCILATGDGRSLQTAYSTVTMDEQFLLIEQYFRVTATRADFKKEGDAVYNSVEVKIPDAGTATVYFRLDDRMVKQIQAFAKK